MHRLNALGYLSASVSILSPAFVKISMIALSIIAGIAMRLLYIKQTIEPEAGFDFNRQKYSVIH